MLSKVKYRENKSWIVGSSIVKNGFLEARSRPGGSNLCLKDGEIWWQGKGGMLTNQLSNRIRTMLNFEYPPDHLIIHVGVNDLGSMSTLDLCNK
jgi:hypothetical protein